MWRKLINYRPATGICCCCNYTCIATSNSYHRKYAKTFNGNGAWYHRKGHSNFDQIVSPDIPVGIPSTLLERRPDIMAAEKSMQAQFERIGVAQATVYLL
jgi:hypothetical protein